MNEIDKGSFLDSLGADHPANDGAIDIRAGRDEAAKQVYIEDRIDALLTGLQGEGLDEVTVRNVWTNFLLRKLVSSNPFREPMDERAVYSDWVFLEQLGQRIDRIMEDYAAGWKRAPRSFERSGHFSNED